MAKGRDGMKVFGLAGWSGSGKTTLMVKLVPEMISRGLTVSTFHTLGLNILRREHARLGYKSGFTIFNPNAVKSCACGSSFQTADGSGQARACC